MEELSKNNDFVLYLIFIFTKLEDNNAHVTRQVSGLLLKNNIAQNIKGYSESVQQFIKQSVIICLSDKTKTIRRTAASIISTLLRVEGLRSWKGVLAFLHKQITTNMPSNLFAVDGALGALELICEDCTREIIQSEEKPLTALVPMWIALFQAPESSIRKSALACINFFIPDMPEALTCNSQQLLKGLFALANDKDDEVVEVVCKSFNSLTECRISLVEPFLSDIIKWMLHKTKSDDEDVALEASSFWQIITDAEFQGYKHVLAPYVST